MPVKEFTKEFKQLCQTYDKVLKNDHATNFKNLTNPMNYLVINIRIFIFFKHNFYSFIISSYSHQMRKICIVL